MSRRILAVLLLMSLLLAACGGDGSSDTTTADGGSATTEAPSDTEGDEGSGGGVGDIPQECVDLFTEYLQEIEPVVSEVDWETADMAAMEEVGTALEASSEEYETAITEAGCDQIDVDLSDEESFRFLTELAENEAPGTVAYLAMIQQMAEGFGEGSDIEVSGDCETDIATIQALVDEGGTMSDRPIADLGAITGLLTSVASNCSAERSAEFLEQPDIAAFMEG
jgi:ribosomal protein L11 methylase PrmA